MDTAGKVAIVTGGAQGIGRACCLLLAQHGFYVVCGDANEEAGRSLEEWSTAQQRQDDPSRILFVPFDASQGADCERLVNEAINKFGRIDVLFNNVGIQPALAQVPIHLLEEQHWDSIMDVNLKSIFWMCKFCIPHMMEQNKKSDDCSQCSIINNASIQAISSQPHVPAYAASKGGIVALTRQLACDYGRHGIRVNAVSPGTIATELARKATPDFTYVESNTPLGRVGDPDDVASLVLFLAGEGARWITGQNIPVDGGITIKGGWAPLAP